MEDLQKLIEIQIEDDDIQFELNNIYMQERLLIAAIINLTIHDLKSIKYRNSAIDWFTFRSKVGDEFTFLECCEYLDIPPQRILDKLVELSLLEIKEPT